MSQGFPITPSLRVSGPYTAGAGQTAFSVTFPFQRQGDLSVQVRATSSDPWDVAVLGTDYTVTGAGAAGGGTVTFGAARPAGSLVRTLGLATIASEQDAVPAGSFDSATFNFLIDRIAIWMQEARRDLDDLLAALTTGSIGWSPVHGVASDGDRRVVRVVDWVGGTGTKPATGSYLGPAGYVAAIGDAVDLRGPQGIQGIQGIQGVQGIQGLQGIQGAAGTGVAIQGSLADPGDLPGSGSAGQAWLIDGDLYVWTGAAWENVGTIQGPAGPAGPGLPTGGTAGQMVRKVSGTDYDTEWVTLSKSSVGLGSVDNTSDANKPVSTAAAAALALKSAVQRSLRQVSATTATLELGDAGNIVEVTHASAKTLTVPPSGDVPFLDRTQIDVVSDGGGTLTLAPGSGVALVYSGDLDFEGTLAACTLIYKGANIWLVVGAS